MVDCSTHSPLFTVRIKTTYLSLRAIIAKAFTTLSADLKAGQLIAGKQIKALLDFEIRAFA